MNSNELVSSLSYESIESAKLAEREYIYSIIEGILLHDVEKYIQINKLKKYHY